MSESALTAALNGLPEFCKLKNGLPEKAPGAFLCVGAADSQKCQLAHALSQSLGGRPLLFVSHSELKAREAYGDLCHFFGEETVFLYPSKDPVFFSADVKSGEIVQKRFLALNSLLKNEKKSVVLSIEALFDRLTDRGVFASFITELAVGDVMTIEELTEKLALTGYERCHSVYSRGQFAVRGGIVDVFGPVSESAVRIEFWGDEIDSLRTLDINSQRSSDKLESVGIFPMKELIYEESMIPGAIGRMEAELAKTAAAYEKKGMKAEAASLRENIGRAVEKFKTRTGFSGADNFINFFYDKKTCLLDYLSQDYIIVLDEPARTAERAESIRLELNESLKGRVEKGFLLPSQADNELSYAEVAARMGGFPLVLLSVFAGAVKDFRLAEICEFRVKSSSAAPRGLSALVEELRYLAENKYRVLVLAGPAARGKRLLGELLEEGFWAEFVEGDAPLEPGKIILSKGSVKSGFEYPEIKLAVVSLGEFSDGKRPRRSGRKRKKGARIESFTDLKIGDYVVHDNHGVGVYRGIEKITSDGVSKDYMKLSYADGGSLFVHTSQMDMVQKFIGGGEDARPKINKLGGADWGRAKAKARAAVKELAVDLAALYARRRAAQGFIFSRDTVWQAEFESLFPYEETEDQLAAIEDVKRDMESPAVMDRLICGDVGYGKTEIAVRAAFKAANDGKQVAVLVPTTILAQQHYATFSERMRDYPLRVDLLSRFRSPKQQAETARGVKSGAVDIVIGTHRLLSKDLRFKNLGLIVVDEEQRFGVSHKEKLKEMRENVDVLTLTATPIPRTLHMSLSGIRDMSVLEEPPHERRPVQTYVMEYEPSLVRDAVRRELARGGQVYFLHNRVKSIDEAAARLRDLVPEARIAAAHGQMYERELENVMMKFIERELDVLVCTTIIETGLDIPNVDTIIVADSDRMGLAQLYQLRGRVGRSNRMAYAYLMYRKDKVLTEDSEKRLQTIREFTEFGSGIKIAMRDLEIRGSGNLLGAEQSGHMAAIGYDAYCKLLNEAILEVRGESASPGAAFETSIDLNIDAYIPSYYIEDETQKLEVYKKISEITGEADYFDVQEELEDRFGDLPACAENLLGAALTKAAAHAKHITGIVQRGKNVIMTFLPDAGVNAGAIERLVSGSGGRLKFTVAANPFLTYRTEEGEDFMKRIREIAAEL